MIGMTAPATKQPIEVFGPQGLRQWIRTTLKLCHAQVPIKYAVHELVLQEVCFHHPYKCFYYIQSLRFSRYVYYFSCLHCGALIMFSLAEVLASNLLILGKNYCKYVAAPALLSPCIPIVLLQIAWEWALPSFGFIVSKGHVAQPIASVGLTILVVARFRRQGFLWTCFLPSYFLNDLSCTSS